MSDRRHYNRIMAQTIAPDGGEQSVGCEAPGAMKGWEHAESIDPRELALTATRQALVSWEPPSPERQAAGHHGERLWRRHLPRGVRSPAGDHLGGQEGIRVPRQDGPAHRQPCGQQRWTRVCRATPGAPSTSMTRDGDPAHPAHQGRRADRLPADRMGPFAPAGRTGSGRRESHKFAPPPACATPISNRATTARRHAGNRGARHLCQAGWGGSVQPGTGEFNFNAGGPPHRRQDHPAPRRPPPDGTGPQWH